VLYSHTSEHRVLIPWNIIAGKSQAPNQYRVLVPFITKFVDDIFIHNQEKSDKIVIFLSIWSAYVTAGILFYRSSHWIPTSLLGLLALLGCFIIGMQWKYRQEFFEVTLVSLTLLIVTSVRNVRVMYILLAFVTLLGSLNRETFFFCVTAVIVYIVWQYKIKRQFIYIHVIGIIILLTIFIISYVGPRWYYGLSPYHCSYWVYNHNFVNLKNFTSPYSILHLGAGLLFAYFATVIRGNRYYIVFILGYAIPMFLVAVFISSFSEHRVFYPLMVMLVASMLGFLPRRKQAKHDIEKSASA
jgi:hypothetical protein